MILLCSALSAAAETEAENESKMKQPNKKSKTNFVPFHFALGCQQHTIKHSEKMI